MKDNKLKEVIYRYRLNNVLGIPFGMIIVVITLFYFGEFFKSMFFVFIFNLLWIYVVDIYYLKKYGLITKFELKKIKK